jgi:predicted  nucleic acid-binding Zn-ribbon protein
MQNPSASDPSFKAFLEKLQEQNNRGFATQLVQLKAEREIAGEDGDKREEQLDQANENLKNLKDETTSVGDNLKSSLQDLSEESFAVSN